MNDPLHHARVSEDANALSKHTTPTWEVELLISGATVFALMQLPSLLDRAYLGLQAALGTDTAQLLFIAYVYFKAAVIVLIGTFILHLGLRAYWVALVGLHSVYPDGIRWESATRWGPIQRAHIRERTSSIPDLIERADNRSSIVFGAGIGTALALLLPMLSLLVGSFAVGLLICGLIGHWNWFAPIVYGVLMLVLFPFLFAILMDRCFGRGIPEHGLVHRGLAATLRGYRRIGMGNGFNIPLLMFTTQFGRRGILLIQFVIFASILVIFTQRTMHTGEMHFNASSALPRESATASGQILNDHYANRRDDDALAIPYIDDLFASGSYLALFIPYVESHEPAQMHSLCAGTGTGTGTGMGLDSMAGNGRFLRCYAHLHPVALDGRVLDAIHFDVARDPKSGQRGLIAMLPTAGLTSGRHELSVGGMINEAGKPMPPDCIPFWR